jgi:hypothetical protein
MKKILLLVTLVLILVGIFSCQHSQLDTPTDEPFSSSTLSKDTDFNKMLLGINNLERQIIAKIETSSSLKREQDFKKLISFLNKGDNLNNQDLIEITALLGYSDVDSYKKFLIEQKNLGEKLREKFPSIELKSIEEKNQLFKSAIQESAIQSSTLIKKNSAPSMGDDGGNCDKPMLAACMAGAYGAYVVVLTSNCPAAAVFGPWGVTICAAGASITYYAALYTCGRTYGCNQI